MTNIGRQQKVSFGISAVSSSQVRWKQHEDPNAAERVVRAIQKTGHALAECATGHSGWASRSYDESISQLGPPRLRAERR
jgi:hypothetical protein